MKKPQNMIQSVVYHGRQSDTRIREDIVFFSSSEDFSRDYGEVKSYNLMLHNPFHTCMKDHVELLISRSGLLTDPYSEEQFSSFDELEHSGLLYHDTWEIFEPHINLVETLGYDGMVIYEGGIENYVSFNGDQYQEVAKM